MGDLAVKGQRSVSDGHDDTVAIVDRDACGLVNRLCQLGWNTAEIQRRGRDLAARGRHPAHRKAVRRQLLPKKIADQHADARLHTVCPPLR